MQKEPNAVEKKVVSISLGSSQGNARRRINLGGSWVQLERIGTDGDLSKMAELLRFYDGKVDAIGLGGTDLYLFAGGRRYIFQESRRLAQLVCHTPLADGSKLKNIWEKFVVEEAAARGQLNLAGKKVLLVCATDRYGMAQALAAQPCTVTFGDLMFGLGLDLPIRSLVSLDRWAFWLLPLVTKLPLHLMYPVGRSQEERKPRFAAIFQESDVIAGDFHFIRRFMPDRLEGKVILTNTTTPSDREFLQQAGVCRLITTTPCLEGRSFGTNLLEAAFAAVKQDADKLQEPEYLCLLQQWGLTYSCTDFSKG